jgi:hypothetical protein
MSSENSNHTISDRRSRNEIHKKCKKTNLTHIMENGGSPKGGQLEFLFVKVLEEDIEILRQDASYSPHSCTITKDATSIYR